MRQLLNSFLPVAWQSKQSRPRTLLEETTEFVFQHRPYRYPTANTREEYAPESYKIIPSSPHPNSFYAVMKRAKSYLNNTPHEPLALPILIGVKRENEQIVPCIEDFADMISVLVTGLKGSGKTRGICTMLLSLMLLNHRDSLKVFVIDLKNDLYAFKPITTYYNDLNKISDIIENLKTSISYRQRQMAEINALSIGEYNHKIKTQRLKRKLMAYKILLMDEIADLKEDKRLEQATFHLNEIARKGRSAGLLLILATQRPDMKAIDSQTKSQMINSLAFCQSDEINARVSGIKETQLLERRGLAFLKTFRTKHYVKMPLISTPALNTTIKHIKTYIGGFHNTPR